MGSQKIAFFLLFSAGLVMTNCKPAAPISARAQSDASVEPYPPVMRAPAGSQLSDNIGIGPAIPQASFAPDALADIKAAPNWKCRDTDKTCSYVYAKNVAPAAGQVLYAFNIDVTKVHQTRMIRATLTPDPATGEYCISTLNAGTGAQADECHTYKMPEQIFYFTVKDNGHLVRFFSNMIAPGSGGAFQVKVEANDPGGCQGLSGTFNGSASGPAVEGNLNLAPVANKECQVISDVVPKMAMATAPPIGCTKYTDNLNKLDKQPDTNSFMAFVDFVPEPFSPDVPIVLTIKDEATGKSSFSAPVPTGSDVACLNYVLPNLGSPNLTMHIEGLAKDKCSLLKADFKFARPAKYLYLKDLTFESYNRTCTAMETIIQLPLVRRAFADSGPVVFTLSSQLHHEATTTIDAAQLTDTYEIKTTMVVGGGFKVRVSGPLRDRTCINTSGVAVTTPAAAGTIVDDHYTWKGTVTNDAIQRPSEILAKVALPCPQPSP